MSESPRPVMLMYAAMLVANLLLSCIAAYKLHASGMLICLVFSVAWVVVASIEAEQIKAGKRI